MKNTPLASEVHREVRRIVHQAGRAILDVYNSGDAIEIASKADDSPLTPGGPAGAQGYLGRLAGLAGKIAHPIGRRRNSPLFGKASMVALLVG